jgi:thiamine-phosphate pyrophosphorylase
MKLYYITDRSAFPGDEDSRRRLVLYKIGVAARAGVDYIQLREKDLSAGELEALARAAMRILREVGRETRLLLNSRTDLALAAGADGVHLRGDDISPRDVGTTQQVSGEQTRNLLSAVSCHSVADVRRAEAEGASFAVLAPIFGKQGVPALGLESLRSACRIRLPVLALGGVTLENAGACVAAGAAGIAAIRLFQENDIGNLVRQLRRI